MLRVVVMGVAGSGKSTVGRAVAERLAARYVDADDVHSPESVAKMAAGIPLVDADRWPWLERLRAELAAGDRVVVACSALRRAYRDVLREAGGVRFVFLDLDPEAARRRVVTRTDHFMGARMVESQFAVLERPAVDESDVTAITADRDPVVVIDEVVASVGP